MHILTTIQSLNFPPSQYILIGGAAMAIRGMKETKDIDILVSKELLESLQGKPSWHHHPRIIATEEPGLVSSDKLVELYPTIASNTITFDELKAHEEIIEGVPVAHLDDIMRIKEFYHREKDQADVALIAEHLHQQ